ncbi:MAG: MbnP family protein [Bacteroidota bacterium]
MKRIGLLLICCLTFGLLSAQRQLQVQPVFDGEPLVLEDSLPTQHELQIESLRFYLSKFELYEEGVLRFAEQDSYHLIDLEDPSSMKITLPVSDSLRATHLHFQLGVDSLTNMAGAQGGDLDPMHGMYWTWQSGYINFKLEGTASNCPARQNRFMYHIGGFQAPYNSIKQIELQIPESGLINLQLAVDQILQSVDQAETYQIMSPSEQALEFARQCATAFQIAP